MTCRILVVQGSMHPQSVTAVMLNHVTGMMKQIGARVDVVDFRQTPLPMYIPGGSHKGEHFAEISELVSSADGFILGTPDYHGLPNGNLKNFTDYFWREFTGKLFGYVVASHEKGLTTMDTLRVCVRQCYGFSLPYGVSGIEGSEVEKGCKVTSEKLNQRLTMLAHDMVRYTTLLAKAREETIAGSDPSFLAMMRESK
jgi:azobenzene reductase